MMFDPVIHEHQAECATLFLRYLCCDSLLSLRREHTAKCFSRANDERRGNFLQEFSEWEVHHHAAYCSTDIIPMFKVLVRLGFDDAWKVRRKETTQTFVRILKDFSSDIAPRVVVHLLADQRPLKKEGYGVICGDSISKRFDVGGLPQLHHLRVCRRRIWRPMPCPFPFYPRYLI